MIAQNVRRILSVQPIEELSRQRAGEEKQTGRWKLCMKNILEKLKTIERQKWETCMGEKKR